jgi:hypothetical protein
MLTGKGAALAQSLFNSFQNQYEAARKSNLERYQNILAGYTNRATQYQNQWTNLNTQYGERKDRIMGYLDGLGGTSRQAIADRYAQEQGRAQQSLRSRGLGNTTVGDSVSRGLLYDRNKAEMALDESLTLQRMGLDQNMSGEMLRAQQYVTDRLDELWGGRLDVQERRTDSYPDPSLLANLALQLGANTNKTVGVPSLGGGGGSVGGVVPSSRSQASPLASSFYGSPQQQAQQPTPFNYLPSYLQMGMSAPPSYAPPSPMFGGYSSMYPSTIFPSAQSSSPRVVQSGAWDDASLNSSFYNEAY